MLRILPSLLRQQLDMQQGQTCRSPGDAAWQQVGPDAYPATFGRCAIASSTSSVGYSWSWSFPWWYCS